MAADGERHNTCSCESLVEMLVTGDVFFSLRARLEEPAEPSLSEWCVSWSSNNSCTDRFCVARVMSKAGSRDRKLGRGPQISMISGEETVGEELVGN